MAQSNYQVNLLFNANTQQAKAQLQSLQTELNKLTTNAGTGANLGATLDSGLQKAKASAQELKSILAAATNSQGTLDLSQFNTALKQSGKTLQQFATDFKMLGPAGQQAFQGITRQVMQAQVPIRKTNVMLDKMATTMANTVRWQISATVLQGFMSAIRTSFQYAQDLNESLNNIRIVTGYSVDKMDKFAEKANKAAKALSASTTAYTDAALIYYQQGLGDKAVEERTNTTMKLANVTGQSAETVSEWMTAIWNNFDDGSKSLEYYADVITALGAATASSSEEIATGLEKFAAVAETTGLSYEYATAALATVTAETRQSADVVGTAFKTLFARIQDLELGKTLEDGVTTGKYAQALETVGVQVIEANGDLRDMDLILSDLGKRWDTLTSAQQVSLAQTVAGMRQYNQFLALMSNWDVMQQNLLTAQTSEGELTKQQDIWSESWEAANKRVEAASQDLYDDLIDDDFFIKMTDMFAKIVDGVGDLIDAMGGLRGLLPLLISGMTTLFGQKMLMGVREFSSNMGWSTKGKAINEAMGIKSEVLGAYSTTFNDNSATTETYDKSSEIQNKLMKLSTQSTQAEQTKLNYINNQVLALEEQVSAREKALALAKEEAAIAQNKVSGMANFIPKVGDAKENIVGNVLQDSSFLSMMTDFSKLQLASGGTKDAAFREMNKHSETLSKYGFQPPEGFEGDVTHYIDQFLQRLKELFKEKLTEQTGGVEGVVSKVQSGLKKDMTAEEEIDYLKKQGFKEEDLQINKSNGRVNKNTEAGKALQKDIKNLEKYNQTYEKHKNNIDEVSDALANQAKATGRQNAQQELLKEETDKTNGELDRYNHQVDKMAKPKLGETILGVTQSISSLSMGLSSCVAAFENLSTATADGKLSFKEMLSFVTSLSMGLPMLIMGMKTLKSLEISQLALLPLKKILYATELAGLTINSTAQEKENAAKAMDISLDQLDILLSNKKVGAMILEVLGIKAKTQATKEEIKQEMIKKTLKWQELVITLILIAALLILVGITKALTAAIKASNDARNKDNIAAEKARDLADELAAAYDNAKEKYDALINAISRYEEAENALEKLKQGTDEWNEGVQKVNESVQELIALYPELAQFVTQNQGVLSIDENALATIQRQEAFSVQFKNYQKQKSGIEAKQAEIRAKTTAGLNYTAWEDLGVLAVSQSNPGMALGLGGPISSALFSNKLLQEARDKERDNTFNALKEIEEKLTEEPDITNDELEDYISHIDGLSNRSIKALTDNIDATKENTNQLSALDTSLRATELNNLVSQMQNTGILTTNRLTDSVANRVLLEREKNIENKRQEIDSDPLGSQSAWDWIFGIASLGVYSLVTAAATGRGGIWEVESEDSRTMANWYAKEILGADETQDINIHLDSDENAIKFDYFKDGEKQDAQSINLDTLEQMYAEYLDQEENIEEYAKLANDIQSAIMLGETSSNLMMQAFSAMAQYGNLGYMDLNSLEQLKANIKTLKPDELSEEEKQLVQKMFNLSAEELDQAISDKFNNMVEALEGISIEEAKKLQQEARLERAKTIIGSGATELEISESVLEAYAEILRTANTELEDHEDLAATAAVSHFKMAKGIKQLRETFEEYNDILFDANANTLEYAEAIGALKDDIDATFGTDVNFNTIEENLPLIQEMINGSGDALEEFKKILAEDFVLNLDIDETSKNKIVTELENFINTTEFPSLDVTAKFDDTEVIDLFNNMLVQGTITKDQLTNMFSNLGLEIDPSSFKMISVPSVNYAVSKIVEGPGKGDETVTQTTTYTQMPWIGDTVPTFELKPVAGQKISYGAGKSLDVEQYVIKNKGVSGGLTARQSYLGELEGIYSDIASYGDGSKKDFEPKKLEDELERYHEITKVIEIYESELERIDILKENAFGTKKLQYMKAEIEKTKELTEAHKKEKEEIESYLASDKDVILQYGVSFDEYGNISNYSEVYANMLAQFNTSGGGDAAEEAWELFTTRMDKYEETLEQLRDQENTLLEDSYKEISLTLEHINEKVEQSIGLTEDEITVLEHQLERLEDTAFDSAEAIALIGKQAETSIKQWEAYQTGIKETLGATFSEDETNTILFGGDLTTLLEGKELTADQIEQLREYRDGLLESESTLREQAATVREEVVTAFEEWNEEMARGTEQIAHQQEMLENYKNIIDIVGKDTLGISDEIMANMERASVNASKNLLSANKSILDANKQAVADAYAEMDAISDPEQKAAFYRDVILNLEEQLADSENNFMDSWTAALETASEAFDNNMARISESYSKALGGIADSLEQLTDQFEKQSELADYYLKDYEKTYEISKLNRQINQSIDDSDSVAAKQALASLQNELLAYQKEGKQMSDYDLQYLQKKYDLTVAQIALEEAQNAKSQVRLQRDSLGNYGYVYTADQGAVDSAQQTYEDKLYDIQQFMDESMQDLQGRYLELNQQYLDELNSLDKTAEDYKERAAAITAHYQELLGYVAEDMDELVTHGAELNREYGTTAKETFNETILGNMYNDLTSFQELHDKTAEAMKLTLDGVNEAYNQWQKDVSGVLDLAGTSVEDFSKLVDKEAIKINGITDGIAKNTEDMKTRMSTAFDQTLTAAGNFANVYGQKLASIKDANDQLSSSINHLIAAYSALTDEDIQSKVNQKIQEYQNATGNGSLGNVFGGNNYINGRKSSSDGPNVTGGTDNSSDSDTKPQLQRNSVDYGVVTNDRVYPTKTKRIDGKIYVTYDPSPSTESWWYLEEDIKEMWGYLGVTGTGTNLYTPNIVYDTDKAIGVYKLPSLDTGGYTGSWGPEGRLAMLHQKEIVLNAHDTKNLLDTVSIVRSIVDQIELSALASQQGIGILRAAAVKNTTDTIQQNVTIEAHFPNATDHNEIEQAFNNLVNDAAQYANRK